MKMLSEDAIKGVTYQLVRSCSRLVPNIFSVADQGACKKVCCSVLEKEGRGGLKLHLC